MQFCLGVGSHVRAFGGTWRCRLFIFDRIAVRMAAPKEKALLGSP
jgi:hypothetical protein